MPAYLLKCAYMQRYSMLDAYVFEVIISPQSFRFNPMQYGPMVIISFPNNHRKILGASPERLSCLSINVDCSISTDNTM